ncbi:MAG: peptidoglycan DD-metalloendopeptidase family protein [bacterium]
MTILQTLKKRINLAILKIKLHYSTRDVAIHPGFINRKKILISLGFIFLGSVAFFSLLLVLSIIPQGKIVDSKIANLSSNGVTITWVTEKASNSEVILRSKNDLNIFQAVVSHPMIDDRDQINSQTKRYTHFVTLKNLNPDTEYTIFYGGKKTALANSGKITFKTKVVSADFKTPVPLYGNVNTSDNFNANDAIVFLISDQNISQDIAAVLVNSEKNWVLDNPVTEGEQAYKIILQHEKNFSEVKTILKPDTTDLLSLENSVTPQLNLLAETGETKILLTVTEALKALNSGNLASTSSIETTYSCSGSCNSGKDCNAFGNPGEGSMWSCLKNQSGVFKCFQDTINSGGTSCFLNCSPRAWQPCNCDIAKCQATCIQNNQNNPAGHYTYTDQCLSCQQSFTCGCDIGNIKVSPTVNIPNSPRPSVTKPLPSVTRYDPYLTPKPTVTKSVYSSPRPTNTKSVSKPTPTTCWTSLPSGGRIPCTTKMPTSQPTVCVPTYYPNNYNTCTIIPTPRSTVCIPTYNPGASNNCTIIPTVRPTLCIPYNDTGGYNYCNTTIPTARSTVKPTCDINGIGGKNICVTPSTCAGLACPKPTVCDYSPLGICIQLPKSGGCKGFAIDNYTRVGDLTSISTSVIIPETADFTKDDISFVLINKSSASYSDGTICQNLNKSGLVYQLKPTEIKQYAVGNGLLELKVKFSGTISKNIQPGNYYISVIVRYTDAQMHNSVLYAPDLGNPACTASQWNKIIKVDYLESQSKCKTDLIINSNTTTTASLSLAQVKYQPQDLLNYQDSNYPYFIEIASGNYKKVISLPRCENSLVECLAIVDQELKIPYDSAQVNIINIKLLGGVNKIDLGNIYQQHINLDKSNYDSSSNTYNLKEVNLSETINKANIRSYLPIPVVNQATSLAAISSKLTNPGCNQAFQLFNVCQKVEEKVLHTGVDIISKCENNSVLASYAGIVTYVRDIKWAIDENGQYTIPISLGLSDQIFQLNYGNLVIIYHPDLKKYTYYAHLQDVIVKNGQQVNAGDQIGHQGQTGAAASPYLHFEVRAADAACINSTKAGHDATTLQSDCLFNPDELFGANQTSCQEISQKPELSKLTQVDTQIPTNLKDFTPDLKGVYSIVNSNQAINDQLLLVEDANQPLAFLDVNANQMKDSDEPFLYGYSLSSDTVKTKAIQYLNIRPEWTAFTVMVDSYTTTSSFLRALPVNDKYEMAMYEGQTWQIATLKSNQFFGTDSLLIAGNTYFIRASSSVTYPFLEDYLKSSPAEFLLNPGWNFVALTNDLIQQKHYSSYSLLQACLDQNVNCISLNSFDNRMQNSVVYQDTNIYGIDYLLKPEQTYLIQVAPDSGGKVNF